MDAVCRSLPLMILFVVFTLIAITSTAISSIIDPTDEVMYLHKWEEHFEEISNDENRIEKDQDLKRMKRIVKKYMEFKDLPESNVFSQNLHENNLALGTPKSDNTENG